VSKLREKIDPGWGRIVHGSECDLAEPLGADLVLLDVPPGDASALARALEAAARLRDTAIPVLVMGGRLSREDRIALYRAGVLASISLADDSEELAAHLESLLGAKRPAVEALRRVRQYASHLDEQLRLAQRLQMDFLPHHLPEVEGGRFAARLEPAAWVAGDFYDIFRLDEKHVGFYVADAVGHGIPAALLTVFIKKSLQTKRIEGKHYELIPPDEAMRLLNTDLLSAELRETVFVTMVYGQYDETTRECVYVRAGHPRPLLLHGDRSLEQLDGEGPLLGIFPDAGFDLCRRRLEPGQRLIFYSDGAERVGPVSQPNAAALFDILRANRLLPVEAMLDAVLDAVHEATHGGRLADDVTLLALDLESTPE